MEPQTTCPASMTWRTPTPVCPGRRSRRQKVACTRVTYVTRHSRRAVPCCDTNTSTQVGKDWGSCSVLHSLSWVHLCRCWGFQNTLLPFSDFLKKKFLDGYCLVKDSWVWWGECWWVMWQSSSPSWNVTDPGTQKQLQLGQHKVWHGKEEWQCISCFLDTIWPCSI